MLLAAWSQPAALAAGRLDVSSLTVRATHRSLAGWPYALPQTTVPASSQPGLIHFRGRLWSVGEHRSNPAPLLLPQRRRIHRQIKQREVIRQRVVQDEGGTDDDAVPEVAETPISRPGDVWLMGGHRVLCGDATLADSYGRLLGGDLVDMVFTDPPYNVNYANSAKDKMRGKDRAILNDNLGDGFYDFLLAALTPTIASSRGAVYVAMSSSELDVLQAAFRAAGGHWSTFIIWAKNTFTLGRADYQRQYEPILYGWPEGGQRHWCGDRDQGDVWNIKKPQKNDLHPTMKPVELVERAIRNSSRPGNVVLDPFGGSGTTLIAAEKAGRLARLIELDPRYVDVIVRRWQDWTGKQATRESDGVPFEG